MSIQRRGKMVGNPHYTLTSEGYSKAINGTLPDEMLFLKTKKLRA